MGAQDRSDEFRRIRARPGVGEEYVRHCPWSRFYYVKQPLARLRQLFTRFRCRPNGDNTPVGSMSV